MIDIKRVCDVKVGGIDHHDYPDYCDAFISEAWLHEGRGRYRELTEEELEWLNEQEDYRYKQILKFTN